MTEKYFLLFVDTLYSNFLLCVKEDFAFSTMQNFGYDMRLVWPITLGAIFVALIVNYIFGVLLAKIFEAENNKSYQMYQNLWHKYYLVIFIFALLPIAAKAIIVICGFFRFKFLRSLFLALIIKLFYYNFLL